MLVLSIAAAASLLVAVAAYAQTPTQTSPPARPKAPARAVAPGAGPVAGLNLTQSQRDQLRSIREAQRPETQALREKMRAARQVLHEVMSADVPDEAAVRAAAAAVAALQADQAVLLARAKGQFMSVLTPEQQAQWKAARARTAERAQRIRMRMGRMMRQEFARQWRGGR